MKRIFLLLALATMTLFGCKEEPQQPSSCLEARINQKSQVLKSEWLVEDEFGLYDGHELHKLEYKGGIQFETAGYIWALNRYYAYYPFSAINSADNDSFNINFPAQQQFVDGKQESNVFPMLGVSEPWTGKHIGMTFRNLASVLVINIQAEEGWQGAVVESISVIAERNIAGKAKLNCKDGTMDLSEGSNTITLDCKGLALSESNNVSCYVIMPPGSFRNLKFKFNVSKSGISEYTLEGEIILVPSGVHYVKLCDGKMQRDNDGGLMRQLEDQIAEHCSPYVASVIDVDYAPGQFTNTLPSGMGTKESAIDATAKTIVGKTNSYVHLGGWGGSVTVGFDHPILNLDGADFRGYGNAFGGSSEPGVYYVAQKDANGNPGEWYLIRHAMYDYAIHDYEITYYKPEVEELTTTRAYYWEGGYSSTAKVVVKVLWNKAPVVPSLDPDYEWRFYQNEIYMNSNEGTGAALRCYKVNMVAVDFDSKDVPSEYSVEGRKLPLAYSVTQTSAVIEKYIRWTDNLGHSGYENKNQFHKQSYWPEYATETIKIKGEYLPVNSFSEGGTYVQDAKYWGFPAVPGSDIGYSGVDANKRLGKGAYGYCDNYPNAHPYSCIDIDWAVDKNGDYVQLDHIDFIKVQSATHKQSGSVGEISTEFCGIADLHLLGEKIIPDTSIVPDISSIPHSGDPLQPETGLLYWPYQE